MLTLALSCKSSMVVATLDVVAEGGAGGAAVAGEPGASAVAGCSAPLVVAREEDEKNVLSLCLALSLATDRSASVSLRESDTESSVSDGGPFWTRGFNKTKRRQTTQGDLPEGCRKRGLSLIETYKWSAR
jgi:hypothetical protein